MKIVYVLTSFGRDTYSTAARISLASARVSNPSARIILAVDKDTKLSLENKSDQILGESDEVVVCDAISGNNILKSRFIKTSISNYISGKFLLLDTDTFIRSGLEYIFSLDSDVAGAVNNSKNNYNNQLLDINSQLIDHMRWKISDSFYINSGVLYFNSTSTAKLFCETWHKKWLDGYRTTGMHHDQPAFNASIQEIMPKLTVLNHKYNAQFKQEMSVANNGAIFHYYASANDKPLTAFETLVQKILGGAELNMCEIRKMVARRHPWRCDIWLDNLLATRVMRKGSMDDWERTWFEGRRMDALRQQHQKFDFPKLRKKIKKLKKLLRKLKLST